MSKIKVKRTIKAERERVFAALTNAGRLREWFCDWARTEPRVGGRYTFRWNSGYEAQGSFIGIEAPEEALMVWQGSGELGPTVVKWKLEEEDEGTEITLKHAGFGTGARWKAAYAEAEKAWTDALENLQSVLEAGVDLREARRPFLGVFLDGLTPERIAEEGIATETGVYIINPVEGGAAEAAGIQGGDVIVSLGGHEVSDFGSLTAALQASHAGDTVEVALVRKQERLSVQATLKQREQPQVPADLAEAVTGLRERHTGFNTALAEATSGLSEELAGQAPAEGEWSVKQVLAHLIATEPFLRSQIAQTAIGLWQEGTPDFGLAADQNAVVLAAEPTLAGLLARFVREQEETALLLEHLSEGTRADPYRYRQIVIATLNLAAHTEDHVGQVQRTVEAVRGQPAE